MLQMCRGSCVESWNAEKQHCLLKFHFDTAENEFSGIKFKFDNFGELVMTKVSAIMGRWGDEAARQRDSETAASRGDGNETTQ